MQATANNKIQTDNKAASKMKATIKAEIKKDVDVKSKPEKPIHTVYWTNGLTKTEIAFSNVGIMAAIIIVAFSIIFTICYQIKKAAGLTDLPEKKEGYMPMVQE